MLPRAVVEHVCRAHVCALDETSARGITAHRSGLIKACLDTLRPRIDSASAQHEPGAALVSSITLLQQAASDGLGRACACKTDMLGESTSIATSIEHWFARLSCPTSKCDPRPGLQAQPGDCVLSDCPPTQACERWPMGRDHRPTPLWEQLKISPDVFENNHFQDSMCKRPYGLYSEGLD